MPKDKIPEEILKEWIEKGKPLVDSAYNLAIDAAIHKIKTMYTPHQETAYQIITSLNSLKK